MGDELITNESNNVSVSQSEDDLEKRESENKIQSNEETKDVVFKKPELIIGPRRSAAKFGLRKIGVSLERKSETVLPDSTTDDNIDNVELKEDNTDEVLKKAIQHSKLFPYKEPLWRGLPVTIYSLEVSNNAYVGCVK